MAEDLVTEAAVMAVGEEGMVIEMGEAASEDPVTEAALQQHISTPGHEAVLQLLEVRGARRSFGMVLWRGRRMFPVHACARVYSGVVCSGGGA